MEQFIAFVANYSDGCQWGHLVRVRIDVAGIEKLRLQSMTTTSLDVWRLKLVNQ